ncbi:response regulator transcription factor [Rufibacter hautae]|uniref:Response regulator transcription factor n=1 Tax=Rufibacter hautae TaxID=2595005 RepID=A0A5B6TC09_9BACT|nr:response regulator transcription factor [Rufibacter hautae]KAA3437708.1 response regulator transcription factor [Rufibacter hautae]
MQKITVGIVEDNAQLGQDIRDKLALTEEIEVTFEVRNGKELLQTLGKSDVPQVLLMDVQMPEMNGIEATWQVKKEYKDLKIVMLTVMDDEQKLFEALKAGASGYLLKDAKPHQLLNAIIDVIEGGLPLSPTLASRVLSYMKGEKEIPKQAVKTFNVLSKRENEVLECLKRGLTVKQISDNLFIANKTVRKHLEHIYEKLHVHSVNEAIIKGLGL